MFLIFLRKNFIILKNNLLFQMNINFKIKYFHRIFYLKVNNKYNK